MKITFAIAAAILAAGSAFAAPVKYTLDSDHTYPSVEADHFGGLSTWRGKFNKTSGTIVYDREAGSGTLDVTIDTASVDFGHDKLNEHVRTGGDMLDTGKYPTATYTGKLAKFVDGAPTEVDGTLTLHGVSKPVTLKIDHFGCRPHPMKKGKEVCGANATATINRADFGVDWGKAYGFKMDTKLEIQVEALKD
jgi:polyisoprenoid-binding protein YceI